MHVASIDDVITLTVTKATATATRVSFGNGLLLSNVPSPGWAERVRTYTKLSAVLADFPVVSTVNHPAYDAATALFSQNPRPKRLKIGRRALPQTETYTLTVLAPCIVSGNITSFTLQGTTYSYTSGGAETTFTVATALAALLDPIANLTASSGGTAVITITSTLAGDCLRIGAFDSSKLSLKNTTPDPGVATDLAAIVSEDNDWHDLALDAPSHLQIVAAAAYMATMDKELWYDTSDTLAEGAGTADIGSVLKGSLYANVIGFYNKQSSRNFRCMRAMGIALTRTPGSYSLKFKGLVGDEGPDPINDTADGHLKFKELNRYIDYGAGPMLTEGVAASGEFEDNTRFLHWFKSETKARVLEALAGPDKVPMTDPGIDVVGAAVRSVISDGIEAGGIADDASNPPSVTVPHALDVSSANRAARNLTGVEFQFRLAGAIHSASVEGSVSV